MKERRPIDDDEVVLRRPHFGLDRGALFFLAPEWSIARLGPSEVVVWNELERGCSVGALRRRFPSRADASLRRLLDLGTCELAPRFSGERRRVLVIEPHNDDAALSVGGTMWARRNECEFTLATAASRSNSTRFFRLDPRFLRADEVSALRDAEGTLLARLLGGHHLSLGLPDSWLRYHAGAWTREYRRRHLRALASFTAHFPSDEELGAFTEALGKVVRDVSPDELWLPLGAGMHADHQLTRSACLSVLIGDPSLVEGRTVRLYGDVPYADEFPAHTTLLVDALSRWGGRPVQEPVDISEAFAGKLRLLSLYASQFSVSRIRSRVEAIASRVGGSARMAELFWRLEPLPRTLRPMPLHADAISVRASAAKLGPWLSRHQRARRIRIVLLEAAGRWAEDTSFLLRTFPDAEFDVYASSHATAETDRWSSARVRVRAVPRLRELLALTLARLWLEPGVPVPTVVVVGRTRGLLEVRHLTALGPRVDVIVLPTMDQFVLALQSLARPGVLEV